MEVSSANQGAKSMGKRLEAAIKEDVEWALYAKVLKKEKAQKG